MTDHRIGLTLYRLNEIMDGDLDEVIDALTVQAQSEDMRRLAGNAREPDSPDVKRGREDGKRDRAAGEA